MNRRRYLVTATGVVATLVSGCIGSNDAPGAGDGSDATSTTTDDSGSRDSTTPTNVVRAYLDAADAEDVDAMDDVVHSSSPLQNALDDGKIMFKLDQSGGLKNATVAVADASADEILQLEYASVQFEQAELARTLEGSDAMLVDVELENVSADTPDRWVLVTENGEWRIFWLGKRDEAPADLDAVLKEPIRDEDGTVVEEITYNDPEKHEATVRLTESPGIDADVIRIESTVEGHVAEFDGSWSGSWAVVPLHSGGDQIVVTAITNGTEEVVHRVHYEP